MTKSLNTYSGKLFDMHCHPGFSSHAQDLLNEAASLGIGGFGNVVTPQEYDSLGALAQNLPDGFMVGAGLHPWWVEDNPEFEKVLHQVCEQINATTFIGEVGLDGSPYFAETFLAQKEVFLTLLMQVAKKNQAVLSIHSSKAASVVLDLLEQSGICPCFADSSPAQSEIAVIFHWFNGSGEELKRALEKGCYFSVNMRMLNTKRGRAYVAQIPENKLLLETDLPQRENQELSALEWRGVLEETLIELAEIRKTEVQSLGNALEQTSKKLLGMKHA
ncbi:MAG: TatD family hydrolase [Anaerotardibacter sp.]